MIEWRHSSAISVSANWNSALTGFLRYWSRSTICWRIISNQMPVFMIEQTSCRVRVTRCRSVISSHSRVP